MDKTCGRFCSGALIARLGLPALAFPLAAMTPDQVVEARKVVEAEELGEFDLGDFGKVSALDMVTHYIENPPAPVAGGTARKVRFEGC